MDAEAKMVLKEEIKIAALLQMIFKKNNDITIRNTPGTGAYESVERYDTDRVCEVFTMPAII